MSQRLVSNSHVQEPSRMASLQHDSRMFWRSHYIYRIAFTSIYRTTYHLLRERPFRTKARLPMLRIVHDGLIHFRFGQELIRDFGDAGSPFHSPMNYDPFEYLWEPISTVGTVVQLTRCLRSASLHNSHCSALLIRLTCSAQDHIEPVQ